MFALGERSTEAVSVCCVWRSPKEDSSSLLFVDYLMSDENRDTVLPVLCCVWLCFPACDLCLTFICLLLVFVAFVWLEMT